jgi:hypothetical protein
MKKLIFIAILGLGACNSGFEKEYSVIGTVDSIRLETYLSIEKGDTIRRYLIYTERSPKVPSYYRDEVIPRAIWVGPNDLIH